MKKLLCSISLIFGVISLFANHIQTFEGTYIPKDKTTHKMIGTNPNTYTPQYVQIKGFEKCLSTKSMGTWRSWCLPQSKPNKCSTYAWQKLKNTKVSKC